MTSTDDIGLEGLDDAQARRLFLEVGPNSMPEPRSPSLAERTARTLVQPPSLLLSVAGVVTWLWLGEAVDGLAIFVIVVLNTIVNVVQERRADVATKALRDLSAPTARVRRSGATRVVSAADLVPGDVIEIGAGERVPADATLWRATGLTIDESMLTGESVPVEKRSLDHPDEYEPTTRVYAGTMVLSGLGVAIVSATAGDTEMGKIAGALSRSTSTPLEREMRRASQGIGGLAISIGTLFALIALTRRNEDLTTADAILAGVAMAVAVIPEGLVIAVTSALALGAQRMAAKGMIVRRLSAIDALGCASVLCSDKTGTLTHGQLSVSAVAGAVDEAALWTAVWLNTDAALSSGDPVDIVLHDVAEKHVHVRRPYSLLEHLPFDTAIRFSATVHDADAAEGRLLVIKGAPEVILGRCADNERRQSLEQQLSAMLNQGLRVIAIAQRYTDDINAVDLEPLGLLGLSDPVRDSARLAVEAAHEAGIRVVMVTGDHAATAEAVGRTAGIEGEIASGADLSSLRPDQREAELAAAGIVARVDPFTKVELVRAHQHAGRVVAMTGDGVNDAPALRQADVGVAVSGQSGTDVAREAADLVITRGDLSVIVDAIAEGRRIYRNVVSTVSYLLSGNLCEVMVMAAGLLLIPELAVPLLPLQILWINLVTDGLPALALGVDDAPSDVLRESPRPADVHVLNRDRLLRLFALGAVLAFFVMIGALVARSWDWSSGALRAELVTSIVVGRLGIAYVVRSDGPVTRSKWWQGRPLHIAVVSSLIAQVATVTIAPLRDIFDYDAMPIEGWFLVSAVAVGTLLTVDAWQLVVSRLGRRRLRVQSH